MRRVVVEGEREHPAKNSQIEPMSKIRPAEIIFLGRGEGGG